jgi:hypothetical protein
MNCVLWGVNCIAVASNISGLVFQILICIEIDCPAELHPVPHFVRRNALDQYAP